MMNANIDEILCLDLTRNEVQVLEALVEGLYAEPGFSDVGVSEISEFTKFFKNKVKGVVGSLVKKGLLFVDEEYKDCIYLNRDYWYLHNRWAKELESQGLEL